MTNAGDSTREHEITRKVRGLFFFRQWPAQDIEKISRHVRLLKRRKDEVLFLQNDRCEFLYILLHGEVQMFVIAEDGRQTTLHMLGAGALVACAALFLEKSYPASARIVSSEAELLAIEGGAFLKLLAERPDLSLKMIAALAARIGELAARLESQSSDNAVQRLAQWLLEQPSRAEIGGKRIIHLEASKKSIAAGLGMTPETFSRSLKKLCDTGAISVSGRRIQVNDSRRLASSAA